MSLRKHLKKRARSPQLPPMLLCNLRDALDEGRELADLGDMSRMQTCKRLSCSACGPRFAHRWYKQHELKVHVVRDECFGLVLKWKRIKCNSKSADDLRKFIAAAQALRLFLQSKITPPLPGYVLVTEFEGLGVIKTGPINPHVHVALFISPQRLRVVEKTIVKCWRELGGVRERQEYSKSYSFKKTLGYLTKDPVAAPKARRRAIGAYLLNVVEANGGKVRVQKFGGTGLSPQGFKKLQARARYHFLRRKGLRPMHLGVDPDERYHSYCPQIKRLQYAQRCEKCGTCAVHEFIYPRKRRPERWRCVNKTCRYLWTDQPVTKNIASPELVRRYMLKKRARAHGARGYNRPIRAEPEV